MAGLGVPQLDEAIERRRQELRAVAVERDVAHALRVATVRAHAAPLLVELPQLDLGVHRAREEEVTGDGKELHLLYAFGVALVRVYALLGYEALAGRLGRAQIAIDVLWYVQKGAAQVVARIVDVQYGAALLLLVLSEARAAILLGHHGLEHATLLVARLRHELLVLVVRPRSQVAVHVRRVVVAIAFALVFRTQRHLLEHSRHFDENQNFTFFVLFCLRCNFCICTVRLIGCVQFADNGVADGVAARIECVAVAVEGLALVVEVELVDDGLLHVAGDRVLRLLVELGHVRIVRSALGCPHVLVARIVGELFHLVAHIFVLVLLFLWQQIRDE